MQRFLVLRLVDSTGNQDVGQGTVAPRGESFLAKMAKLSTVMYDVTFGGGYAMVFLPLMRSQALNDSHRYVRDERRRPLFFSPFGPSDDQPRDS